LNNFLLHGAPAGEPDRKPALDAESSSSHNSSHNKASQG
jgi:hypothetical protein